MKKSIIGALLIAAFTTAPAIADNGNGAAYIAECKKLKNPEPDCSNQEAARASLKAATEKNTRPAPEKQPLKEK